LREAPPASGVFKRPQRLPPSNAEFKVLYDTHFRLVWCALTRLGVRDADLMDLTQKVFLVAFLKLPEFEGRSLLSTWLWGICRRVAIAHRRSGPMRYEVATDPIEFEVAFEQRAGTHIEPNSTRQVAVEHMLSKLSESQRVVFRLSEVDDLDGPQIATLLNVSLGTVRSRLRYARQRIRREVKRLTVANTTDELIDLACGGPKANYFEVSYEVSGKGLITEATVARVRNGVVANYAEPYMRRRDPDCMLIGDGFPTDKEAFQQRCGSDFEVVRQQTFDWLKNQELVMFGFVAGGIGMGMDALVIAPANAGFFALSLAMLQGIVPCDMIPASFVPRAIIYVAPVFRHTHFDGKQVVVHNRRAGLHELFSYNLYPGPSAKKGIYGVLLGLGEREGWVTTHCSTVQVVTPYDNVVTIMHEGASGGGKSEMLEQAHREPDGRLLLGENIVTGERRYLEIPRTCSLQAVTDDMALCHPSLQEGQGKLTLTDAENAWFVRVNHIEHYGTDVHLERLTAEPPVPLLFLNIDAPPAGRDRRVDRLRPAAQPRQG